MVRQQVSLMANSTDVRLERRWRRRESFFSQTKCPSSSSPFNSRHKHRRRCCSAEREVSESHCTAAENDDEQGLVNVDYRALLDIIDSLDPPSRDEIGDDNRDRIGGDCEKEIGDENRDEGDDGLSNEFGDRNGGDAENIDRNRGDGECVMDPCYRMFLKNLKLDGKSYILQLTAGKFIKYEAEDLKIQEEHARNEESSESEQFSKHSICCEFQTTIDMWDSDYQVYDMWDSDYQVYLSRLMEDEGKVDGLSSEKGPCQKIPERKFGVDQDHYDSRSGANREQSFREKLMDVLQKPFNLEEFKELMHQITEQKPVQMSRELRGREAPYSSVRLGKSYCQYQSDFDEKMNLVRHDQPRALNLMRGFVFWLKHLTHGGAFHPWKDSSCLEVVRP